MTSRPRGSILPARGRVRVWHFIVYPALGMGAVLLLGRTVEALLPQLTTPAADVFQAVRAVLTTLLMAALIAWLAIGYRTQYEDQLEVRNRTLEQTRDFLSGVIEGSGEAIVTLDAEDRIASWNPAAETIFGWSAREIEGESYTKLIPDLPRIRKERNRVGQLIRSGQTVRDHETIRLRKDGSHVTNRITWSPLYDRERRYRGAIAIVLDVTAEGEMRRRLLEQERLAAVGELAAQVAHEVRNPLAGIRGACEVILKGKIGPERTREMGDEVLRQIDRLDRTVTDLLQFARPKAVEREPTDLNALVGQVVAVFSEDPNSAGIEVVSRLSADVPTVELDPGRMEQVLFNLLLNAAQVMDHEGIITVTSALVDEEIELSVSDNGPGIAPAMTEKVFQPFFSTRARGTGLGLAIVRNIIRAHEGTIEARESPGGGAEFRIRLPVAASTTSGT